MATSELSNAPPTPKHSRELYHLPDISHLAEVHLHVICRSADGRVHVKGGLAHLLLQKDDYSHHIADGGMLVGLHRRCRRGERLQDVEEYVKKVSVEVREETRTRGLTLDDQSFDIFLVVEDAADDGHLRPPPRIHTLLELVVLHFEPISSLPQ